MATTTTNFGWDIPQSTDLVKDGATAIAALGQDIDTALVDLKGGTTGQVLAKATNTDLDFTWVAQDDSNAIQNTQLTAKGALISAVSAGTPATLTVGTNGQVLTADSSTATGLKWAASSSGALIFVTSSAFSASSAVSVNNCFTSTYSNYRVLLDFVGSTDMDVNCRLRAGGTDNTNATYNTRRVNLQASYGSTFGDTETSFHFAVGRATNRSAATCDFFNPEAALQTNALNSSYEPSTGAALFCLNGLTFRNTTQFDGFSLIPTSGTITGTVRVYAYANS